MGSKGSTTQQVNQTSHYTPSPQITAAGTQALQGGQAAAQQPFWLPQQPIAGFTPDQLAAFQNVRNIQGMTAPWFGQAGNLAMQSATPLTADQIANFYNPMAQNVTNQMQNIFGQQMRDVTGKLTQAAGGVGADRIAVGQSQLANQQGLAAGQTYADLYQRALNAAMQNQQMQANAAYAMGNLGQGAQGAALQGSQALLGVGGLQQQLAQARLMSPYAWLGQQFAYPYQANQYLAGITGALVPAFPSTTTGQSTSTTTPPQPSPISQGLGLGMAAYGAYSDSGKGTNLGSVGGTNPFTGGSSSAIYRHGGRVHRQMGGQAGSGFGSISPFTSTGPTPGPGIPPPALQGMQNIGIQRAIQALSNQNQMQPQGAMPGQQSFGTGSKGGFGGRGFADGGAAKAPAIPQMSAGTASDMDAYFADINKQAQDLSAMSRYAMQPTGTGGWQSPFYGTQVPQTSSSGLFGGKSHFLSPFRQIQDSQETTTQGFASGGASSGGIGDDPFGDTDSFVPDVHLTMSNFHGPDLPKISSPSGSSSGKGSTASTVGTAIGTAAKFLPMLLAAHGGGVMPHLAYQRFAGDDGMTDIADFPFTPPDTSPIPPSPEELRPPVPTPFAGWGEAARTGLEGLRPTRGEFATPQEAEQARMAKELSAKQVAATPEPGPSPEAQVTKSPFAPALGSSAEVPINMAGFPQPSTVGPTSPAAPTPDFGGFATRQEQEAHQQAVQANMNRSEADRAVGAAPVTPVQSEPLPKGPFELPVAGPPKAPFEAGYPEPASGPTPAETVAGPQAPTASPFQPQTMTNVPMPQPRPDITQAPMPQPRPDIAGPPGQAFGAGRPPIPVSRQSVAQDTLYFANKNGIPPQIALRLINRESGFNPNVRGAAGEIGAGQLMPATARELGVNPHDPQQNLDGAMRYLKQQYDRFGNWPQAIAAYNAGPGAVASGRIPASTQAYVRDVAGGGQFDTTQLSAKALTGAPPSGPTAGLAGPTSSPESQYLLPGARTPFPQAGAQAPGGDLARNPWVMAGLRIAAGTSPWAGVNIGAGASAALEKQREQAEKEVGVNQKAQALWQQMQQHIDSMTKLSAAQQLEAMKPFRIGVDPETGLDVFGIRDPATGSIRKIDLTSGQMIGPPIGGTGAAPAAGAGTEPAVGELPPRDAAVEKFKQQDEEAQKQYAAPELAPNLVPEKQPGTPIMKGPFATGEAATIRAYNDNVNKKVRPALDFQREQITRLKLDYATIMRDEGEGFFTRMAQLPGSPSPEGRIAAMRLANNTAIANRQPPPFDPAKIAAMEEVQKIQATMGMSFAATISPRDSQQMQMAAIAAQPGLTQSPQGFQRLIGLYDGATGRSEDRIKFWNRWQQVNPHRYSGFDDDFETKNPAVSHTVRSLVENSPYPQARQRLPDAIKYLREHKDDAAYRQKFDKVYGGTSSYFLNGVLDPYALGARP